jgi:hypothetical protein
VGADTAAGGAQTLEAAQREKARLGKMVGEKDRKIAFMHEEKDMLLQHLREALDDTAKQNAELQHLLDQVQAVPPPEPPPVPEPTPALPSGAELLLEAQRSSAGTTATAPPPSLSPLSPGEGKVMTN